MLSIIDPITSTAFPSVHMGNRQCYAVPHNRAFAVRVEASVHSRHEAVISVDGRNVLDNTPAAMSAGGVVFTGSYVCKGFQISASEARQFVHMPAGFHQLTAERTGAPEALGIVAVALYGEQTRRPRMDHLESFGGPVMRGVSRGGGAMAGAEVSAPLGQTTFTRGDASIDVVEYDTFEGWAARGIVIPRLSDANPWPGSAPRFAATSSL